MPSEALFYPSMKVKDVIAFAARARKRDCFNEARRLCGIFQVDGEKKIEELSLGNRKKVSIICAMQHRPKILILDEPTSGLDPLMQEAFFELILEYSRQGTTCFLSSHVLSEVKSYCRHAAIIKDGKIVRTDSVENLLKSDVRCVKIKSGGRKKEFVYTGKMEELIHELAGMQVEDVLIEKYSEYEEAYQKAVNRTWGYMFNMMIMERNLLSDYCIWVFDILFEVFHRIDTTNYSEFAKRYIGRISEILFNVWIEQQLKTERIINNEIMELKCHVEEDWKVKVPAFLKAKFFGKKYARSF